MSPSLMRSYYHGEYAWQNRVLDVSEACEESVSLQRKSLQLQAKGQQAAQALQIEQQQAAQEQHEEMLSIAEAQSAELMGIRAGQEVMTDEIRRGMSLIVDRLDEQIQVFSQAVTKLEEINQTLKIPRATEANELFSQGERWFRQGLYEESLDAYLKAEQIYKVHYLLQFRVGSLFLEGRNRRSNVIDLSRAEPHLLLATRYAEVQDKDDSRAQRICGDAYYRAGKTAYLLAEEKRKVDDLEGIQTCLQRALGHLAKSVEFWSGSTATVYWQAKCHALLGQKQEVLEKFAILSDRNRKYHADAMEDGDFQDLQNDIRAVFTRALDSPGPQARSAQNRISAAQAQLNKTFEALGWARRSNAETESPSSRLQAIDKSLRAAKEQLPSLNVDVDYLLLRLDRTRQELGVIRRELDDLTEKTFEGNIAALQLQISQLRAQKTACESRIDSLKREMNQTEGNGAVGCVSVVIFAVLLQAMLPVVLSPWREQLSHTPVSTGSGLVGFAFFVGYLVLGYMAGIWVSRSVKNSPLRAKLNAAIGDLSEWEGTVPAAIQQAQTDLEKLTEQMNQFVLWRKSNSVLALAS